MTDPWTTFAAAALAALIVRRDDDTDPVELAADYADYMCAELEKRRAAAEPPAVPRGHCSRCDRCGWEFGESPRLGCTPGNCSMRPVPSLRSHCAGCGAPFEEG